MVNRRIPIVGVMGSGKIEYSERTTNLGRWLALNGFHLLTGGGKGVMASISRAFFEVSDRKGSVIGVLPSQLDDPDCRPKEGYPNPWVEIPILTHLPLSGNQGTAPMSRNHINILSSDIIIALPGGAGTLSEVELAEKYLKPIVAYLRNSDELPGIRSTIPIASNLEAVQEFVAKYLSSGKG